AVRSRPGPRRRPHLLHRPRRPHRGLRPSRPPRRMTMNRHRPPAQMTVTGTAGLPRVTTDARPRRAAARERSRAADPHAGTGLRSFTDRVDVLRGRFTGPGG